MTEYTSGGFTKNGYVSAGIVHKGEYVIPAPYDYPKWWLRISRFVRPRRLKMWIQRKVRVYNPDKDLLKFWEGFKHE